MSGYTASARLHGGSPRFIAAGPGRPAEFAGAVATVAAWLERERLAASRRPIRERLTGRLNDLRETWSQTTFYLFDPESWR